MENYSINTLTRSSFRSVISSLIILMISMIVLRSEDSHIIPLIRSQILLDKYPVFS
jgi:hypothetical protein